MDAVGARVLSFAPGAQEVAVSVEYHHRVLAAIEHIDVVFGVDPDCADLLERPAVRQPRPVLNDAVPVLAAPDYGRHALSPGWGRAFGSVNPLVFLQRSQVGGVRLAGEHPRPQGPAYLADIEVAVGIRGQPVWPDERGRRRPGKRVADPRQQVAL